LERPADRFAGHRGPVSMAELCFAFNGDAQFAQDDGFVLMNRQAEGLSVRRRKPAAFLPALFGCGSGDALTCPPKTGPS